MTALGPHPFVAIPLVLIFLGWWGVLIYDVALWYPRKFGWTQRSGLITRLCWWALAKALPKIYGNYSDYGEWRSKEWRDSHGVNK